MRHVAYCFAVIAISACRPAPLTLIPTPELPEPHPLVHSSEFQYLSCNYRYFDFHTDYTQRGASESFLFALMSSNAYNDPRTPQYRLPGWDRVRYESRSGLAFDVYRRTTAGARDSIVVAYEGTNPNQARDWFTNFSLWEPRQYRQAHRHLDSLRRHNPDAAIIATGHSLGGGIALNMSLRIDSVTAVAFNTSPRIAYRTALKQNRRLHVYETGEILGLVNRTWARIRAPDLVPYKFNFLNFTIASLSPIKEHDMYLLSRGVLLAAVRAGNPEARRLFAANVDRTLAQRVEWDKCSELYQ